MTNGNGNKVAMVMIGGVAAVGIIVGGALWMQDEGHGCELAISKLEARVTAIETRLDGMGKRLGRGGWPRSAMEVFVARLAADADHKVPDLSEID